MKKVTLKEYRQIVAEAQAEEDTWKKQEYLAETIYTTPDGRCLWEESNWWLDSETIAKREIRNYVWHTWIGNIWTLRDLLRLYKEKGGPSEEDKQWGWTIGNIEAKIANNFTMLSSIFGMSHDEIESGVTDYIAYRKSFESLPSGSKERATAIYNQILLPEKGHQFCEVLPTSNPL